MLLVNKSKENMKMEIRNILLKASNKDETVTAEDLLAIAILPITLFKTESDIIKVLDDFKKLIKNNDVLDDNKIKENIVYLMDKAGFEYPNESMEINSLYYPPYENKPESFKKPKDLIEHFTNSLYYIHEKVHRETVESDKEKLPFKKIENAMNFFDSMQKINASDLIKEGAKDISRFSKEVVEKVKNSDGKYIEKKVRIYTDRKKNVLDNILYKKANNKKILSAVISATIISPVDEGEKLVTQEKEDDLMDSLTKEFSNKNTTKMNEDVQNVDGSNTVENNNKEKPLAKKISIHEMKEELKMIAHILAYKILAEKSFYNKEGLEELYLNVKKRFKNNILEVTKTIKNKKAFYKEHYKQNFLDKVKSVDITFGDKDFIQPDGFNIPDFLKKVSKGFLLTKNTSNNINQELDEILQFCMKLIKINYPLAIPSEETVNNIKNKEINDFEEYIKQKKAEKEIKLSTDLKGFKVKYKCCRYV